MAVVSGVGIEPLLLLQVRSLQTLNPKLRIKRVPFLV